MPPCKRRNLPGSGGWGHGYDLRLPLANRLVERGAERGRAELTSGAVDRNHFGADIAQLRREGTGLIDERYQDLLPIGSRAAHEVVRADGAGVGERRWEIWAGNQHNRLEGFRLRTRKNRNRSVAEREDFGVGDRGGLPPGPPLTRNADLAQHLPRVPAAMRTAPMLAACPTQ